jgi:hypothetical protein
MIVLILGKVSKFAGSKSCGHDPSIARAYRRGFPAAYWTAIRRGGTVVGDGALGTT